jgi:predicted RNA-binding Zn-ribbon protein involved in translation (DUF1610 family)
MRDYTFEMCPECETEVKLTDNFEIQECPNCHKPIMPCSICEHGYVPELNNRCHSCTTCPLEIN